MTDLPTEELPKHFKGKQAIEHVIEAQTQGIISSAEIHGHEIPGHIYAGADSARETSLLFLLIATVLLFFPLPNHIFFLILSTFSLSFAFWKAGRSSWLGWFRLERLHRVLAEERYEIEHHRPQERQELGELYRAKGFEGKLLEDVLDVLMADNDRLLKVMVQEELGLTLEGYEHPLKQGLWALIGSAAAAIACFIGWFIFSFWGVLSVTILILGISGGISAYFQKNKLIPAIVWNIGLGLFSLGIIYFLLEFSLS